MQRRGALIAFACLCADGAASLLPQFATFRAAAAPLAAVDAALRVPTAQLVGLLAPYLGTAADVRLRLHRSVSFIVRGSSLARRA